jgi:ketosteroid isomerase-like protein
MSENLDLVRSLYTTWERGDYSSVVWADPEIEYVIADGPTPGTWIGLAEMAEALRSWLSAWENYRVTVDEFREVDEERVLVFIRRSGRGKTSGLELAQMPTQGATVLHLRRGKVTQLVAYADRDHALADLGLKE